jgi:hypothetical protein
MSTPPTLTLRPTTIEQTVGYIVDVRGEFEDNTNSVANFKGVVESFDAERGMVVVKFDNDAEDEDEDEDEGEDKDEYDWMSDEIGWLAAPNSVLAIDPASPLDAGDDDVMNAPISPIHSGGNEEPVALPNGGDEGAPILMSTPPTLTLRPTTIEQTVGYIVDVRGEFEDNTNSVANFKGVVESFDAERGMVVVKFDNDAEDEDEDEDEGEDKDEYDWMSDEIGWVAAPVVNQHHESAPSVPSTTSVAHAPPRVVHRPPLHEAAGWVVSMVDSEGEIKAEVVGVKTVQQILMVQLFEDKDAMSTLKDHVVDIPYGSVLKWLHKADKTPATIEMTLGYMVEIHGNDDDTNSIVAYGGTVESFDAVHGTVVVRFDQKDASEDAHREVFDWKARNIDWISPPVPSTVPLTVPSTVPFTVPSTVPFTAPSTVPSAVPFTVPSTSLSNAVARPTLINATVGYTVEVSCEEDDTNSVANFKGVVESFDAESGTVVVKFYKDAGDEEGDEGAGADKGEYDWR